MRDDRKITKPKHLQYIWTILKELVVLQWMEVRKHKRWNKGE